MLMRRTMLALAALLAAAAPVGAFDRMHEVPAGERTLAMRVCRPNTIPPAPVPSRLVVFNHGSPADPSRRPAMTPAECTSEAVAWFLQRGYVVALPMRRGYGATGGEWSENYGRCADPDFVRAGLTGAADIQAALDYMFKQDYVAAKPAIVVGVSAGGWASLALASKNPPGVAAIVNFAGGRGGWAQGRANTNCAPDALAKAAGVFGATARIPTIWFYAANDTFFAPELAGAMHKAFVAAGGKAEFVALDAWERDGHSVFLARGGSARWRGTAGAFLDRF